MSNPYPTHRYALLWYLIHNSSNGQCLDILRIELCKCIAMQVRGKPKVQVAEPNPLGRVLPHGVDNVRIRLRRREEEQLVLGAEPRLVRKELGR